VDQEVKRALESLSETLADSDNSIWKAVGNNAAELIAARISISILLALNPRAIEQLEKTAQRVINEIDHPHVRENLRRIFLEQYGINMSPVHPYSLNLPNSDSEKWK
jgi:hypothetical protein